MCAPCNVGREQQRQHLYNQIAAAQVQLDAVQRRRDLARRDLARAKAELERLRGSTKASKSAKQRRSDAATAEANWLAARPQAAALLAMAAGPLTDQVRCVLMLCLFALKVASAHQQHCCLDAQILRPVACTLHRAARRCVPNADCAAAAARVTAHFC